MPTNRHPSDASADEPKQSPGAGISLQELDALTLGAFSASTSAERVACVQQWLAKSPPADQLQSVYRALSHKDKGAAKLLREQLDEIKRGKSQAELAQEWADKAQTLIDQPRMNLADAMAWQRDAAKAGAPLSKEPLLALKTQLADRVRSTEDLQHRIQVQRESAVLLAQRIEVLSTKSWTEAQSSQEALHTDVQRWQSSAAQLHDDPWWGSLDFRFPTLLDDAGSQLMQVWQAFHAALQQAQAASEDESAALPQVPVWAEELRTKRRAAEAPAPQPAVDPAQKAVAEELVTEALVKLESEISQGHGKASAGAASALRAALQAHGSLIDQRLDKRAHRVLSAAGELESWQRWRADQLREELVSKAQALTQSSSGPAPGGHKLQEQLRALREQWKLTDQGGAPNHGLWKKFDSACNQAHKVVEVWLAQRKEEAAAVTAQRQALIDELTQWAGENRTALDDDWRGFSRVLHEFAERWRLGGHLDKKHFEKMQGQWKQAMDQALAPLKTLQQASIGRRQALIEEAKQLAQQAAFQIQAVKVLQQRWQAEAHSVPLDRRLEQKLWDAFRKPIDQAFARRQAERDQAQAVTGARDRAVVDASKALQLANASGDVQQIKNAMEALQRVLQSEPMASQSPKDAGEAAEAAAVTEAASAATPPQGATTSAVPDDSSVSPRSGDGPKRAVVAMRGDDRPGNRVGSAPTVRQDPSRVQKGKVDQSAGQRVKREDRQAHMHAPRLGDAAYRAQRDALEHAQSALRKLAVHAHGEALVQLLDAWQKRDANLVPTAQALGARLNAADRASWMRAIEGAPQHADAQSMLRLEMAAEIPSPAEFLSDRRMLQLQLLTRRHDPLPAQTWTQDVAKVLAQPSDAVVARRLQNVLKVLLRS